VTPCMMMCFFYVVGQFTWDDVTLCMMWWCDTMHGDVLLLRVGAVHLWWCDTMYDVMMWHSVWWCAPSKWWGSSLMMMWHYIWCDDVTPCMMMCFFKVVGQFTWDDVTLCMMWWCDTMYDDVLLLSGGAVHLWYIYQYWLWFTWL
jgi:hypothetical protein